MYSSISGEKIEIKKIQMETPEVIESAEKHPIVKNFIKPNYIKDDMLKIPKEVRKVGIKIEL